MGRYRAGNCGVSSKEQDIQNQIAYSKAVQDYLSGLNFLPNTPLTGANTAAQRSSNLDQRVPLSAAALDNRALEARRSGSMRFSGHERFNNKFSNLRGPQAPQGTYQQQSEALYEADQEQFLPFTDNSPKIYSPPGGTPDVFEGNIAGSTNLFQVPPMQNSFPADFRPREAKDMGHAEKVKAWMTKVPIYLLNDYTWFNDCYPAAPGSAESSLCDPDFVFSDEEDIVELQARKITKYATQIYSMELESVAKVASSNGSENEYAEGCYEHEILRRFLHKKFG